MYPRYFCQCDADDVLRESHNNGQHKKYHQRFAAFFDQGQAGTKADGAEKDRHQRRLQGGIQIEGNDALASQDADDQGKQHATDDWRGDTEPF